MESGVDDNPMNIRKTIAATALATGLVIVPVIAQTAQETQPEQTWHGRKGPRGMRGHHGGPAGGFMFGRAAAALNLTDTQKEFGKQLMADTRKQSEPVRTELKQIRQDLAVAVKANNTADIDRLSQRQGQLMGQLAALHGKAMASFHAQLTPEQQQKAAEMQERMKERAKNRTKRSGPRTPQANPQN